MVREAGAGAGGGASAGLVGRVLARAETLVRDHANGVLVAFAVLAVLAAVPATQVKIDTNVERLMMQEDRDFLRTQEIRHQFSNDEILMVAFDLGRPFEAEDLRALNALSEQVAEIEGVEEVLDLSTIEDVRADGDFLDASALVDLDAVEAELEAIRARVAWHPIYRGNLVSEDQTILSIAAILEHPDDFPNVNQAVTLAFFDVIEQAPETWRAYVSGYGYTEVDANRIISRDLGILTSVAVVLMLALMYWATRRVFVLVLTGALIVWAEVVSLAWFGATGTPLTIVTSIFPTVLLASTSTYAIYCFALLRQASAQREPGVALIGLVGRPTVVAALSTGIGFLSLRLMPVSALSELGTGLTVGIFATALGTLLMLPAAIQRFDLRLSESPVDHFARVARHGIALARRPVATVAAALVVVAVGAASVARLEMDSDVLSYWRPDSVHRQSAKFVRENLSGTFSLNVVIHGADGEENSVLEPEVLAFADQLVRDLEARPEVDRTLSFLDYLRLMDAAIRPEREPSAVLESRELAVQYMLLYEAGGDPDDYRHYIDGNRSTLNVFVRINDRASSVAFDLYRRVDELAAMAPPGVRVEQLGAWRLFPRAVYGITIGMVKGLAVAMVLITIMMALTLGETRREGWRLALIGIVPSGVPILLCTGMMGWLGVPLSFGTSIVGCMALGLAVDDTAHVLGHLRRGEPLSDVYRRVGGGLVLTTLSLGVGFSALVLSGFVPVVHLGAATVFTLLVALACNLFLLPSLLVLAGYRAEAGAALRSARHSEAEARLGFSAPDALGRAALPTRTVD